MKIIDRSGVYEINLLQLTQLCGRNVCKKNFIIESIEKYFSTAKYAEYEIYRENNVLIDGELLGRKYFEVTVIRCRADLVKELKLTKTSIAGRHLNMMLNEFSCQVEMEKIQSCLNSIYDEFNKMFLKATSDLRLDYKLEDIFNIVQKGEMSASDDRVIEELSNFELVVNYLKLINTVQENEGTKKLIIFENIDHFIDVNEYKEFMRMITEFIRKSDLWVMVTTSIDGYTYMNVEYYTGINCINDVIYNMPEYDEVRTYVEFNYPVDKKFENEEFDEIMISAVHNIGMDSNGYDIRGYIAEKLLNRSLCMCVKEKSIMTVPERNFL